MSEIRKQIASAISDPGHTGEGYKGERTLTEWQTDAVMRIVSELEKASVAYVDANTALIASLSAKDAEIARLRWAAEHGLAYAECWVDEHGGIDGCDMNDRIGLEKIRAALQPTSGGEADV